MKKCLPLAFILISIQGVAQIKGYSVSVSGNYPVINSSTHSSAPLLSLDIPIATGYSSRVLTGTLKESYEEKAGLGLQGSLDISVSNRFFITTGLSASYIRYKHQVTIQNVDTYLSIRPVENTTPGLPFGSIYGYSYPVNWTEGGVIWNPQPTKPIGLSQGEKTGETTTLYLDVPVLAGTSFFKNKLEVRSGFVGSWLVQATVYKSRFSYQNTIVTETEYKEKSRDGFNKFLAGVVVQTTYRITSKIGIDVTARKYLNTIYENSGNTESNSKYTLFSLGARYTFKP